MALDGAIKITVPTNVGSWCSFHQKPKAAFWKETEFIRMWATRVSISQSEQWVAGHAVKVLTGNT